MEVQFDPGIVAVARRITAIVGAINYVSAQETYPAKAVTLIVPFPPGRRGRQSSRVLLPMRCRASSRRPVVIENKPEGWRRHRHGLRREGEAGRATPCCWPCRPSRSFRKPTRSSDSAPLYQLDQFHADRATHGRSKPCWRYAADSPWKHARGLRHRRQETPRRHQRWIVRQNYGTMHVPMEMFAPKRRPSSCCTFPFTGAGPAWSRCSAAEWDALATGPSTVIQHVKAGRCGCLASWGDKTAGIACPKSRR